MKKSIKNIRVISQVNCTQDDKVLSLHIYYYNYTLSTIFLVMHMNEDTIKDFY